MVDELMLRDVKNILKKLEVIRAREDIEQILLDSGLSNGSSIDEINEVLVAKFMTQEELVLYKKYVLYKRREDLKNLVGTIDSLEQLTLSVGVLYENIQSTKSTISSINSIVDRVDNGLRGYPNIRVSTAYNRVKVDYRRYFDAYIKDGMDRAVFTEEIDRINHSSAIVRGLKKRRLKQLRDGLREHNKNSKKHVNALYEDYIGSRDEYGSYLREVMTKLLSKNDTLYEAGLLSLASMYGELIPVKTLGTGVKTVDRSVEIEIKPEYIASKAFEYFQKLDEPEFDEKVFIKAFREFLLHFYNAELERLHKSIVLDNKAIRNAFTKQREVMGSIASYQESIVVPDASLDKDTEDTMALVYRNN